MKVFWTVIFCGLGLGLILSVAAMASSNAPTPADDSQQLAVDDQNAINEEEPDDPDDSEEDDGENEGSSLTKSNLHLMDWWSTASHQVYIMFEDLSPDMKRRKGYVYYELYAYTDSGKTEQPILSGKKRYVLQPRSPNVKRALLGRYRHKYDGCEGLLVLTFDDNKAKIEFEVRILLD